MLTFDKDLNPIEESKIAMYLKAITKTMLKRIIVLFNIDISLTNFNKVEKDPLIIADNSVIYKEVAILSKWINSCVNNRQLDVCRDIIDRFTIKYQHSSSEYLRLLVDAKQKDIVAY